MVRVVLEPPRRNTTPAFLHLAYQKRRKSRMLRLVDENPGENHSLALIAFISSAARILRSFRREGDLLCYFQERPPDNWLRMMLKTIVIYH